MWCHVCAFFPTVGLRLESLSVGIVKGPPPTTMDSIRYPLLGQTGRWPLADCTWLARCWPARHVASSITDSPGRSSRVATCDARRSDGRT